MKQYFSAKIVAMAQSEILSMVPSAVLKRIRERDLQPEIRAYSIGHEGEAEFEVVGEGSVLLRMLKNAVRMMFRALSMGTAVFHGHTEDNEHGGREKIGEVVGGVLKEMKGRLNTVAAIYLYPGQAAKQGMLDIASIEAEVTYSGHGSHVQIDSIPKITGIALGSSKEESPGFPGATLLGAVRAFREAQINQMAGDIAMFTLEEIKEAIREGDLTPGQLFSRKALLEDEIVVTHVEKEKQTEFEHARRVETKLGDERKERRAKEKELDEQLAELTSTNRKLAKESLSFQALQIATPILNEKKLDEVQRKFVESKLPLFSSDADDRVKFKADLEGYIDTQLMDLKETSKLLGIEEEEPEPEEEDVGLSAKDKDEKGSEEIDKYMDPEQNEFIPED